jgi:hypothetical protein
MFVPLYIGRASHILFILHIVFKNKFNHVQILWGSFFNICGNICYMLIIIFYELCLVVIVNQKGGNCKGILPLTVILINDDT